MKTMDDTSTHLTKIRMITSHGYHNLMRNLENYILTLDKLTGPTYNHLEQVRSIKIWITVHVQVMDSIKPGDLVHILWKIKYDKMMFLKT